VAREEIGLSLDDTPGSRGTAPGRFLLGDPATVVAFLARAVEAAWHALVEPEWPRIRALLEADIAYRSRRLAEGGLDCLLPDLHPTLRWTGDTLIREPGGDEVHDLGGCGILLLPSAFKQDEAVVITQPPWQPTVAYPARGAGSLWAPALGARDDALARLLGRTRAELLGGLDGPASTTALAHRHALAAATVSAHLAALRDAGLITGERHRHEIRYRRTDLGTALTRAART
jgi:DNA-binding transcriptional ArsR family regulator